MKLRQLALSACAIFLLITNASASNFQLDTDFSKDCNGDQYCMQQNCANYFENYISDDSPLMDNDTVYSWFTVFGMRNYQSSKMTYEGNQGTVTYYNGGGCALAGTAFWPQAQQEIIDEQTDLNNTNGNSQRAYKYYTVTCTGTALPDSTPMNPHFDFSDDFSKNCTLQTSS